MIKITRMNNAEPAVEADPIMVIESIPDSIVSLTRGRM